MSKMDVLEGHRMAWLYRVGAQMKMRDLHCPLTWMSPASFKTICEDKLRDTMLLAPSQWDSICRALILLSSRVYAGTTTLENCREFLTRCYMPLLDTARAGACPLLQAYKEGMLHVLDSTLVFVTAAYEHIPVRDVEVPPRINRLDKMEKKQQAAVWAIRTQVLFCSFYAQMPGDKDKSFVNDTQSTAQRALDLYPEEGQWHTLAGQSLPDKHPRRGERLKTGYDLRQTAFSTMELARHMAETGKLCGLRHAAHLCMIAVSKWPDNVYVNSAYVTLYLGTRGHSVLGDVETVAESLRVAVSADPLSPFLAGLAAVFQQMMRRGRALHTIQEEPWAAAGDQDETEGDVILEISRNEELVSTAMQMYPSMAVAMERFSSDSTNCVCSGVCAQRTFKAYGSLRPTKDVPVKCFLKLKKPIRRQDKTRLDQVS